jgi:hypothetical protein
MDTIGLDVHKRESQLCILAPDGTASERRSRRHAHAASRAVQLSYADIEALGG